MRRFVPSQFAIVREYYNVSFCDIQLNSHKFKKMLTFPL
jgi:hypothetical protein